MFHFLSAMVDGPGYLPLGWTPNQVLQASRVKMSNYYHMHMEQADLPGQTIPLLHGLFYRAARRSGRRACSGVWSARDTRLPELITVGSVAGLQCTNLLY